MRRNARGKKAWDAEGSPQQSVITQLNVLDCILSFYFQLAKGPKQRWERKPALLHSKCFPRIFIPRISFLALVAKPESTQMGVKEIVVIQTAAGSWQREAATFAEEETHHRVRRRTQGEDGKQQHAT